MSLPDSISPELPARLSRNRSFWSMASTQFLGAFNDNLYKQVVLLLCIDVVQRKSSTYSLQPVAQVLFALPFVLFSGFAGFLSDRYSKRGIVVLCKFAEIVIMLAGGWALASGEIIPALAVLFLMGTHSAFFGPAKYGILPELVGESQLPVANGIFLMTTFLAVIFGMWGGGALKEHLAGGDLRIGGVLVGIAVLGTGFAQFVRRIPAAQAGLPFSASNLFVSRATWRMFGKDRPLCLALLMYSIFWLIAGIVILAVNDFGKLQLGMGDEQTGRMSATLSFGIAAGCFLAGFLSHKRVNWRLVRWGAAGLAAGLALLGMWGNLPVPIRWQRGAAWPLLVALGFFTGLFTVPLQVFLQSRPPADQKGRVIGAMNLMNWIGILLAGGCYFGMDYVFRSVLHWPISSVFAAAGVLLIPIALWYRPDRTAPPPPGVAPGKSVGTE